MSPEEIVGYAQKWCGERRGRRFSRRWRLEGSRAGNSGLVGWRRATKLLGLYGGRIAERVPLPPPSPTHGDRARADDLPPCPRCLAEQRQPCRSRYLHEDGTMVNGPERKPHKVRLALAEVDGAMKTQEAQ